MSTTQPLEKSTDATPFVEKNDLEELESVNEILTADPKYAKNTSTQIHQDNMIADNEKLKEKIKWFEDALRKKDKLNEENYRQNELLTLENQALKESNANEKKLEEIHHKKEIEQLKAEIINLKSELKVLNETHNKELKENEKETLVLSEKIEALEESFKLKENTNLLEKQSFLEKIEELSIKLEKKETREIFEESKKMEIRQDVKVVEEKKGHIIGEEIGEQFFLNPIMKIIFYMLLVIYVSFYIGWDRFQSLFRKKI